MCNKAEENTLYPCCEMDLERLPYFSSFLLLLQELSFALADSVSDVQSKGVPYTKQIPDMKLNTKQEFNTKFVYLYQKMDTINPEFGKKSFHFGGDREEECVNV
ncbi:hypothetical protein CEXT_185291 [Caerostris extrusa]|uniref:Uncharacterized protein n=1 Tax=Caerostris extrusa TaxID=172846 RepID=A0AAV4XS22_CAEEX|nr:hypothetical protein CEXT_185291 [Caerostris extrusa]